MTISNAIIVVLLLVDAFLGYMLIWMSLTFSKKIVAEIEEKQRLSAELQDAHDMNLIHAVSEMALLLKLNAFANDYQKFTEVYQQLYFLGVKKEILDNGDLLDDFISRLVNKEFDIKLGEKPFMFDFTEKK